jgi:hypothetical protein
MNQVDSDIHVNEDRKGKVWKYILGVGLVSVIGIAAYSSTFMQSAASSTASSLLLKPAQKNRYNTMHESDKRALFEEFASMFDKNVSGARSVYTTFFFAIQNSPR